MSTEAERGSVTIWAVGFALMLLSLGGVVIDFWRALEVQVELAALADSAALAGASGIDEDHYRTTGELILEAVRAAALVAALVDSQSANLTVLEVSISPDGSIITVVAQSDVSLGLTRLLVGDGSLTVRGTASARARLVP